MKLVFCPYCQDIFKLALVDRACECGKVTGRYLSDGHKATVSGEAVVLGLNNYSLVPAVRQFLRYKKGSDVKAWVFTNPSPNILWEETSNE